MKKTIKKLPIDALNPIWDSLTNEERVYLRENTKFLTYKKGSIIYDIDDTPDYIYCIITGKAKVCRLGVIERPQIMMLLKNGDLFGYRAYFVGENYKCNAIALEAVEVYAVPLPVIKQILEVNSQLAIRFITLLARYFGNMQQRLLTLTQKHIRGRMVETLLYLIETFGMDDRGIIQCAISREDMASLSNMTTANAIRTLSTFVEEGILQVSGRRITILDISALKEIAAQK